jgi:hypothetical protein
MVNQVYDVVIRSWERISKLRKPWGLPYRAFANAECEEVRNLMLNAAQLGGTRLGNSIL